MQFLPIVTTVLLLSAVHSRLTRASTSCVIMEGEAAASRAEAEEGMLAGLEVLWYGTPEERLDTIVRAAPVFRPVCYKPGFSGKSPHPEVIQSLSRYLSVESDDWVRSRLTLQLARTGWCPPLNALFREALLDPSPNMRRTAVLWFGRQVDPLSAPHLEDLWRTNPPSWMRAELLRALSRQERTASFKDLVQLSEDDDLDVALAAVDALSGMDDARVVEAIAPMIGRGPLQLSLAAIDALEYMDEDALALEALLEASRSGLLPVRRAALAALVDFEDPAAAERLIDALHDHSDLDARILAAHALGEGSEHPDAAGALVDVLRGPSDEFTGPVRRAAICALEEIDDTSVLPSLIALPHDATDSFDPLTGLIASLSGQSESIRTCFTFEPPDPFIAEDPEDPRTLCVLPPKGMETVRCWMRPGVAGPPQVFPRLPRGWSARPEDYFDRDGDLWVQVDGLADSECWVPRRLLENCPQSHWLPTAEILRIGRSEFDVPTPLLESEPLRVLAEAELLRIIDPQDDVTGVAVAFEVDAPLWEVVSSLPRRSDRSAPDPETVARMEVLLRRFRDEPLMGPAQALPVKPHP